MSFGIIYFIQPAELIGSNGYKIGCSSLPNISRVQNGYRRNTRYLCIMECYDPFQLEKIIINAFNDRFLLINGREYFSGNETDMFNLFVDLTIKFQNNAPNIIIGEQIQNNAENIINKKKILLLIKKIKMML